MLARRWLLDRADSTRRIAQLGLAAVSAWALSLLAWVAWVDLLGVDLVVAGGDNSRTEVGVAPA